MPKYPGPLSPVFTLSAVLLCALSALSQQGNDSLWAVYRDPASADPAKLSALRHLSQLNALPKEPDSMAHYQDQRLALARKLGATDDVAEVELDRGIAFAWRNEIDHADSCFERALISLGATGDDLIRAKIWMMQGQMLSKRGLREAAMEKLEKARRIAEDRKAFADLTNIYGNMANLKRSGGDLAGAMVLFTRSLQLAEQAGDSANMASNLGNIGTCHAMQGQLAEAHEYLQRQVDIYRRMGGHPNLAGALLNMGKVLRDADPSRALGYTEQAILAAMQSGNTVVRAFCYGFKATLFENAGRSDSAAYYLRMGYELAEREEHLLIALDMRRQMAQAIFKEGRHAEGISMLEEVVERARVAGELSLQSTGYEILRDFYREDGRPAKALDAYMQHIILRDSIARTENQRELIRQEYKYDYEKRALSDSLSFAAEKGLQQKEVQKQKLMRNGFMGGFALVAVFAGVFFFQRNRIGKEKARSEELLLNILPEEVAEELKAKGEAEAKHFESATILFTDFKGFTQASEKMSAQELVQELNTCFKAFDHIITARGIEKIKTIGDAYMCAGGLPDPASSSPADLVHAALEMQSFMKARKAERDAQGRPAFEMRVGIHTGPVVAGIVGVKKFQYDIWGDTVNTASRMESSGEAGQVNISEATYALVKYEPDLTFTPRGKVQAKGKGEMEMYFVGRNSERA